MKQGIFVENSAENLLKRCLNNVENLFKEKLHFVDKS